MQIAHHQVRRNDWVPTGARKSLDPETFELADKVTINLESPQAEDALLAAGMALAKGTPTTLTAPDRGHLPWFLRDADLSYPGQVTVVESGTPKGHDGVPADNHGKREHQTFIGCLMSGLSKEEYAEGRSHLMAIHETLSQDLDSNDNYCEGIKIGSNESFGTPKEALVIDLEVIKGSEQCVFYQYDDASRPSGMWVELGAALAWGKPCTLFAPNLDGVPPAIRKGMPELKVVEYKNHENFKTILKEQPEALLNRD